MYRNAAYRKAEEKIEATYRWGTKELDLSASSNAESSEKLTELPESLTQLTQLQSLNLSRNQLTALPASLGQFTQLQSLFLSSNQLTALPESFGRLTQLRSLDLSHNQLTALPESFGWLTQFQSLDLSRNQLTALPESFGWLTQLQSLDLSDNQLKVLPESFGQLAQLRILYAYMNQLTKLPDCLGQLTLLQELDVSTNQLASLPSSLGQLKQLQILWLKENQIIELPESVGQLKQLHKLDVRRNKLRSLPNELREALELKELYLHENDSLGIPVEILNGVVRGSNQTAANPSTILDYYFSTRGDRGSALRELKLLVVGRGGAGKTSLIRRLNQQTLDPSEGETHGINISPLELTCSDGPVTARVWDFGGQHVLHAMHEFFLTARSLYLLVLGEREDMAERDAAYWLQLIRSYARKAPVVVALNKNQGRPREMDREALEQNYGPILAWVPTECAEGFDHTIENLRAALTKAADGMSEVRNLFPRKWWEVKKWLETMEEPYLDFATYQQRCNQLGEQDPQQQEKLASWLNDLGIAINYANDERLHDTTVLRPEWLANGIYAILRANDSHHDHRFAPDAALTADSLGPIYSGAEKLKMLKADDYPRAMWPFLLQLMKLFQLAFPIDDIATTLLVPTLLPIEPPPDCEEPDEDGRTRLRYEFAVVPGPLLPKLLVRTFSLIEDKRRWRRGAILRYGSARARVWATQDERWVHITASGDVGDRDELLTIIRVTLQELFAEYRNLQAVEQWEHKGKWVPRETLEDFGVLPVEAEVVE